MVAGSTFYPALSLVPRPPTPALPHKWGGVGRKRLVAVFWSLPHSWRRVRVGGRGASRKSGANRVQCAAIAPPLATDFFMKQMNGIAANESSAKRK
jgi:hypothetical protein